MSKDPISSATPWMLALLLGCVGVGIAVTLFILGRQAEAAAAGAGAVYAASRTVSKSKRSAKKRDKEEKAEVVVLQERIDKTVSTDTDPDLEALQERLASRRGDDGDGAA